MKTVLSLINRDRKLFFRDKGMFLSGLMTPIILIILYTTFLEKVYKDSFMSHLPENLNGIATELINGTVAAQLAAALLAVSCVTVTFCVNLTMVSDRANGCIRDFSVSPVSRPALYFSYFMATVGNSLMINAVALLMSFGYMYMSGFYMSAGDVFMTFFDLVLLVLFGAVLSSVICYPLKTQGQMSAVGTIISAGYGFICGAYMPISNFGDSLQKALSFLPSTYGTSLIKNHMLRGVFEEMKASGFPEDVVKGIKDSLDCSPEFLGNSVNTSQMIFVMAASVVVFASLYLIMTTVMKKNR